MKHSSLLVYLFSGALILSSCKKSDDTDSSSGNNNTGGSAALTINSSWQVKAKIDGLDYAKRDSVDGASGVFTDSEQGGSFPDSSVADYGSSLVNLSTFDPYFSVYRNGQRYPGGTSVLNSDFLAYFTPGNYPYTDEYVDGAAIFYTDANGEMWGSNMGSGDQTGSVFTIVQVREETFFPNYDIRVLCHFNCKLYNGSGQSKSLTDGEYVGLFEAF